MSGWGCPISSAGQSDIGHEWCRLRGAGEGGTGVADLESAANRPTGHALISSHSQEATTARRKRQVFLAPLWL